MDQRDGARIALPVRGAELGGAPGACLGIVDAEQWIDDPVALDLVEGIEIGVEAGAGRRLDQLGHAIILRGRQADPEIGAERLRDLFAEHGAERLAGDAAHDLADQETHGHRVIARRGAGLPIRFLRGEERDRALPIVEILFGDGLAPAGESGAVAHDLGDRDARFAARGEFRPIFRDRRVEVDQAAIGEQQRRQRRHRLGGRIDVDDGVLHPWPRAGRVGLAAPQIDHRLVADPDADRGPEIGAAGEIAFEGGADRRERLGREALGMDGGHASVSGAGCRRAYPESGFAAQGYAKVTPVSFSDTCQSRAAVFGSRARRDMRAMPGGPERPKNFCGP